MADGLQTQAGAQEAKPSPENILEWLEDTLEQVISDSIDMDWQPRWAAKRICERLEAAGFDFHSLARIDEALNA